MTLVSLLSIALSATLYFGFFYLNEWLFKAFELHSGANWVFLPAGLRLMCTLVLGLDGAIGLLVAALAIMAVSFHLDPYTGLVAALISSGAPYLVYLGALRAGLPVSLEKLSARMLSLLALVYALANSLLHSTWFFARDVYPDFLHGWVTMFIGDLLGTLIMIYALKIILAIVRRTAPSPSV